MLSRQDCSCSGCVTTPLWLQVGLALNCGQRQLLTVELDGDITRVAQLSLAAGGEVAAVELLGPYSSQTLHCSVTAAPHILTELKTWQDLVRASVLRGEARGVVHSTEHMQKCVGASCGVERQVLLEVPLNGHQVCEEEEVGKGSVAPANGPTDGRLKRQAVITTRRGHTGNL